MREKQQLEPDGNFFRVSHKVVESIQFSGLDTDSRLLYFYLCRYRNKFRYKLKDGYFQWADRKAMKALGWGSLRLIDAGQRLQESTLVRVDRKNRSVTRYCLIK